MKRQRRSIPEEVSQSWTITWNNSPYELWARKFVRDRYWGFDYEIGSREDAMAECAYLFSKCLHMYRYNVTEPRHFMALYMQAVRHRFWRLNDNSNRMRDLLVYDSTLVDKSVAPDAPAAFALASLSNEARTVLQLLMDLPDEVLATILKRRPGETLVQALRRSPLRRWYRLPPRCKIDAELIELLRR